MLFFSVGITDSEQLERNAFAMAVFCFLLLLELLGFNRVSEWGKLKFGLVVRRPSLEVPCILRSVLCT